MELFNKSGIALVAAIVGVGLLIACQAQDDMRPSTDQIEATAGTASKSTETVAEGRMVEWAAQGLPVAQRELARIYQHRPGKQDEALKLLEQAARSGDSKAAYDLSQMPQARTRGGVLQMHPTGKY